MAHNNYKNNYKNSDKNNDKNKCYLVTGVSSGIGLGVAQLLLRQGFNVVGVCRRKLGDEFAEFENNPNSFYCYGCDLSDEKRLEITLKNIIKNHLISGAILCHGFGDFRSIEEFSSARIVEMISVNLISYLLICRLLMPILKRQGFGDLIIIGSQSGLKAGRFGSVYSAAKFGLQGMVAALRDEAAASGVRVSIVNPGLVKTAFFDTLDFQPGDDRSHYLQAEDVAKSVSLMLSLPHGSVIDSINLSPQKHVITKVNSPKNIEQNPEQNPNRNNHD